ncbi:MAG: phosphate ABC transporter permease subunit PstC [Acidimicrobiales bacterium]|jgi:phosphate transport system permease protein|nr:phosphate ABC transporter permease subunit PstC [Acidimicrobiales bacterium]
MATETAIASVPAMPIPIDLTGSAARRRRESVVRVVFLGAGLTSILITVAIVVILVVRSLDFLSLLREEEGSLAPLWSDGWFPRRGMFDLKTLLVGSLIVTGIGMLVAAPLGLGAAVWLGEYASPRLRRTLKPVIEVLAGIPSVVLGFFALTWLSPNIVQSILGGESLFSLMAAGLGVGILTIPLVATVSEDSLRSVPNALREASAGLGARKATTTLRVVLPAATSGLVAAFILGVSRAVGETMVVTIAAGGTGGSLYTTDPLGPGTTMTAAMASLATGTDQVKGASTAFPSLFLVGLLLFAITFVLNIIGERFVRRVRNRY